MLAHDTAGDVQLFPRPDFWGRQRSGAGVAEGTETRARSDGRREFQVDVATRYRRQNRLDPSKQHPAQRDKPSSVTPAGLQGRQGLSGGRQRSCPMRDSLFPNSGTSHPHPRPFGDRLEMSCMNPYHQQAGKSIVSGFIYSRPPNHWSTSQCQQTLMWVGYLSKPEIRAIAPRQGA